ncbi:B-cell receptor CD22-like [Alosa pseudoharengus]|uniref:B-cell receptor CD22-like n=1 Tax=Alosa pseudoharengus TaxID=34774 RepID=UPI003F8C0AB3
MKTLISIYALILGGLCMAWNVIYSPAHICALEGSSVNMSCSYTYSSYLTVDESFWINQDSGDAPDVSKNESYTHRVTLDCGNKRHRCFLNLSKLTKADAQYRYYCRITTNKEKEKWIGKPGISVNVTGLKIVSSKRGEEVDEGVNVTLTCNTTCNLTDNPSFIWIKDGRPVEKTQIINNQLRLHPVRYEDNGSYTCAVRGHEDLPSPPYRLQIMCPVVVFSDIEHVKDGDHVTLTCNTTCNVTSSPLFIWSKDGRPVEKKQIIYNQLQLHPVSYEDEGNYTCAVRGHEGLPSPPCRLQIMSNEMSPLIAASVGVAVCGVVGLLCVLYWLRIRRMSRALAPPSAEAAGRTEDDVQHDSVHPKHSGQTAGGQGDDVLYASVQLQDNRQTAGGQGDDVLYASVHFKTDGAQKSSLDPPEGEPSVIYSSLKMRM